MTAPPAALVSSVSQEWRTPPHLLDAAREVFGCRIDLDPASTPEANKLVRAQRIYTRQDNGLTKSWRGNVWLNPPYGKTGNESNQGIWSHKMAAEFTRGQMKNGLLLVTARTSEKWFALLWTALRSWDLNRLCFVNPRIHFLHPDTGEPEKQPTQSHVVALFARSYNVSLRFCEVFSRHGKVIVP